jgi:hypothetical protein
MEGLTEYTLSRNFRSPAIKPGQSTFEAYRQYTKGQKVNGYMPETTNVDVKFIVTSDGYAIPESAIDAPVKKAEALDTNSISQTVKTPGSVTLPKELQEKLNAIKSTDIIGNIVKTSRSSVNGLMLGAVVGAIISLVWQKPFFASVILTAVAGGATGYVISKPKKITVNG